MTFIIDPIFFLVHRLNARLRVTVEAKLKEDEEGLDLMEQRKARVEEGKLPVEGRKEGM
jgi:hypothetical protein